MIQATDIPGTPPGSASDGPNYLKFLTTMRSKLPSGKTMSIAAPSSYWYLRNFPISSMANQLDYIVYMTYDLHGKPAAFTYPAPFQGSYPFEMILNMSLQVNGMPVIYGLILAAPRAIVFAAMVNDPAL
jgi:hypothetical protein